MRYLSLSGLIVVAGALTAFACGDDDTKPPSGAAGDAGEAGEAGDAQGGKAGSAGSSGKGGGGRGGSGAEAGAEEAGAAGEPSVAGGGTGGGGTGGGGTGGGGTGGGGTGGGGTGGGGTGGGGTGGGGTGGGGTGGTAGIAGATLGSLGVTISGVPTGSTSSVAIAGPNNFASTVSATSTLADLAAGSYTITAPPIRVAGTQVDSVYDSTVVGSPASVVLGAKSTATVSYAKRPGSGSMWVTSANARSAYSFDAAAIAKTGSQTAAANVALNFLVGTNAPATQAIAFSATGDLWLGTCKANQTPQVLAKYGPSKLSASGFPAADLTISLPSTDATYDCAGALAFDAGGNLWVGLNRGRILKYKASDLAATGTPAPEVNLASSYFNGLVDMAFDSAGNLYVASYSVPSIPRLSAAQLAASNSAIVPAVILSLGNAGVGPGGIALASDGSLWVADYNQGLNTSSLFKFKAADLGTTGTPTPTVTITGVPGPEQLAFDKAGNLWVTSFDTGNVVALAAADLTTSGAKTPLTTLNASGVLGYPYAVRFNPGAP